jgi:hypothetical protein
MAQQPFTTAGVAAKQTELYALSDSALSSQADLIRSEFQTWMEDNFSLDSLQQASLASLDADFLDYTSYQVSYAVRRRIDVNVDKHNAESSGKLIHTAGLIVQHGPSGFAVINALQIDITYS